MQRLSCECKDQDTDFHIDEDIEIDYSSLDTSNYDSAAMREIDSLICCPKCSCHVSHKSCGSLGTAAAAAAAAAALLPPGSKKIPASALNYLQCHSHSGCYNHKQPNVRANHNQVKMRLKEKSKKKLEEKASILSSASNAANMFVQETLVAASSGSFTNIDSVAAAAAACVQDSSLTMELFGSLNMNASINNDHAYHKPMLKNSMNSNVNTNNNTANTTIIQNNNSSSASSSSNTNNSTSSNNAANNIGKITLSIPKPHKSKSSSNQNDCCTKQDNCHCAACIQRQKIADELIAEEESSKKKKQKKKKSKSKSNKISISEQQEENLDNNNNKNKVFCEDPIKSDDLKPTDLKSIDSNLYETLENSLSSSAKSKKSKKNKQQTSQQQSSKENETSLSTPLGDDHLDPSIKSNKSKDSVEVRDDDKSGKDKISSVKIQNDNIEIINETNQNTVDIQQWVKVKNKNKQNVSSNANSFNNNSINSNNPNNNNNSNNQLFDHWSTSFDCLESEDANQNDKSEIDENDSNTCHKAGFKIIQNDKRRMSIQNCEHENNNTVNCGNESNNSTSNKFFSSVERILKARLLAIEAQIAFSSNELKGAVQYISEALELDCKNPIYYINRAFYHERLNEFEHALKDTETALKLDESQEHSDHSLYLKAKALIGLEQFDQAEKCLLKIRSSSNKPKIPFLDKDLLILRLKRLVAASYTIPLARLYASKYPNTIEAFTAIEQNCNFLIEKKLNESDPKLHLMLIQQQQQHDNRYKICTWLEDQQVQSLFENEAKHFVAINNTDYEDDEIYFSDEEERDVWYSHPDKWQKPKDILKIVPRRFDDTKEPLNSKGQKALWIGNVSPSCSLPFVSNLFMKFGNVTFCKIFSNEQRNSGDVAYLLLHYDNEISPRLVMSYFKDKIVPGISKDDCCPLLIRFRNKNDKVDDAIGSGEINWITNGNSSNTSAVVGQSNGIGVGSNSPSSKNVSECYYWRTTGCDRQHCTFRHVVGNKGVDKQSWMKKKT